MRRHGGENKTHGSVERAPRIDSFEVMDQGYDGALALSTEKERLLLDCDRYEEWFGDEDYEFVDIYHPDPPHRRIAHLRLARISNGFGGSRAFWLCPSCGERFRYLYLVRGKLRCRKCGKLNYKTQQDWRNSLYYFDLGVKFAREEFGCEFPPGFSVFDFKRFTPDKPEGMHRSTYDRLMRRYERYQEQCREAFIAEALAALRKGGGASGV